MITHATESPHESAQLLAHPRRGPRRLVAAAAMTAVLLVMCDRAYAQRFPGEANWTTLLDHEGVIFRYLHYPKADSENAGVVMMVENTNEYPVTYAFKAVFRSRNEEAVRLTQGELRSGQRKAGDNDGLFWIPWKDQRPIEEVGLRGFKVKPMRKAHEAEPTPKSMVGVSLGVGSICAHSHMLPQCQQDG